MKEVAQESALESADHLLKSNGLIYVVIGVALIILFGIFGYLFYTERKLNRIEKRMKNE